MKEKYFIAILSGSQELDEAAKQAFEEKNVQLVSYYKNLGIVKLASKEDLQTSDFAFIQHLEPDSTMKIISSEEE